VSDTEGPAPLRSGKSAAAYRTIGEVADDLDLPAHVLRFWESKFPQLKPLKRGGGRRYYRPEDIVLLRRIRQCLYQEGYTIRGVQKLLGVPAEGAARAADAQIIPSLFPLEAPQQAVAAPEKPPAMPISRPAAEKPALRRPRRTPTRPSSRAELEDIRRELLEARALLDDLLRPPKS
jgi:DNA-binding transcriptional MerR regulator